MLTKKTVKKPTRGRGLIRINSKAELSNQKISATRDEPPIRTMVTTHTRSYHHSYPDGPIGNYPGL